MSTSKKPLVSVGIPVCNGEAYLSESLDTILHQTHAHLEIIISDDHSADNSYNILKKYAQKDSRIILYRQKKQIKYRNNFNFVLEKASGDFFVWAAQDDIHNPKFIETLLKPMVADGSAQLSMCDYRNISENTSYQVYDPPVDVDLNIENSLKYFLQTHNLSLFYGMFRTSVLKEIGGYHKDKRPFFHSSDFLTIYKTLLKGKLAFTHQILFFKRDTGFFTDEFTHLTRLPWTTLSKNVIRFALFPIHYVYDLLYGASYIFSSKLANPIKIKTLGRLLICTVRLFIVYIRKSTTGTFLLVRRFLNI